MLRRLSAARATQARTVATLAPTPCSNHIFTALQTYGSLIRAAKTSPTLNIMRNTPVDEYKLSSCTIYKIYVLFISVVIHIISKDIIIIFIFPLTRFMWYHSSISFMDDAFLLNTILSGEKNGE